MQARSSSSRYFWLSSGLLFLAIAAVYRHTLDVPFYLDDWWSIHDNPHLKELNPQTIFDHYPTRFIPYFSFALNYALHGLALPGYHLVSLALHFLNSLLVWGVAWQIGHLQKLEEKRRFWLALLSALLFALHPLQTQAVNYIVQRAALFTALFYLLGLWAYFKAKDPSIRHARSLWFLLALLAFGLGLLSKENIVTLPLAWLLGELAFFYRRSVLLAAGMVLGALAFLGLAVHTVDHPLFEWLDRRTRETDWFSRTEYFAAQTKVLWHYLRLFFLPTGLRLDYALHDPPAPRELSVWLALLGHLVVLGVALRLIRRLPILAFGTLFYYLAHAVESSVIPIKDLIFEHRTYLPNFGLALVGSWLAVCEAPRWVSTRAIAGVISALLLVLALLTEQRNQLWRDPIAFWRDNVEKAPHAIRAWQELAMEYLERGDRRSWLEVAQKIVELPRPKRLPTSTLYNLALYYDFMGKWEDASETAREALSRRLSAEERAHLELLLGELARRRGDLDRALRHFCRALEADATSDRARREIVNLTASPPQEACAP